jgi:arylamine N-acetyltransferase
MPRLTPSLDAALTDALAERYLRLLGVAARPPGPEALAEIVAAHVTRVPFENVSKLYYRAEPDMRLPPIEHYLDGIEHRHFGGTCYANNYYLVRLLAHLGYDVRLCGADMSVPDVHVVGIVRQSGRELLLDVGYGAPFLTPMPLDLTTHHEIVLGGDRYVLCPRDADGRSRLELYRDGRLRHGYIVNPAARRIGEFTEVIEHSFRPTAVFMNAVVIARFMPGRSLVLHNRSLIVSERTTREIRRLDDRSDLAEAIEEHFLIPRGIAARALDGVALTADAWG